VKDAAPKWPEFADDVVVFVDLKKIYSQAILRKCLRCSLGYYRHPPNNGLIVHSYDYETGASSGISQPPVENRNPRSGFSGYFQLTQNFFDVFHTEVCSYMLIIE
jgi:hypothetical protein